MSSDDMKHYEMVGERAFMLQHKTHLPHAQHQPQIVSVCFDLS
jgi:hypothetical protein